MLELKNISKQFGKNKALDNISFNIPENAIFGLLGPNGSGKSTLMRILANLITEWDGEIKFKDKKLNSDKSYLNHFGFIIESPCFYEYLSARKNLEILCRLTGTDFPIINELLDLVNLLHRSEDKVSHFSYGMKQRLGIAQALLHDPQVLILDEPNNGLDPFGINQIADILFHLKDKGKTICISTHSLNEVDRLCSDVAIIKNGKLLKSSPMETLHNEKRFYRLETSHVNDAVKFIKEQKSIDIIYKQKNSIIVSQNIKKNDIKFDLIKDKTNSVKSIQRESPLIQFFYA